MTKKEFLKKFKEMRKDHNKKLLKRAISLFSSGGVNTKVFDNNSYQLPKIIMYAALDQERDQYVPYDPDHARLAKKLTLF